MNSQNLHTSRAGATEALFYNLEQDLLALTTASIDEDKPAPSRVVDEFGIEFLIQQWGMPPG